MIKLRVFNTGNTNSLLDLLNNRNVTRYLSSRLPTPYTAEDANGWIDSGSKIGIVRAIVVGQKLIGCVGAKPGSFEESHAAEIGYWIGEPYWGKGYASRAVAELTEGLFSDAGFSRLVVPVFSRNLASMRVLDELWLPARGYRP